MPQPNERDLELTRRQLGAWLQERAQAGEVEIGELKGPSETGFSSDTLMFDVNYSLDGERRSESLVARLEPVGFPVFPSYDVALQYRIMRALAATDVPVPRMRWLETDSAALGVPFYVMDRVEGRIPTDTPPYHTGGWVMELPPERREALWWAGLDALGRVHRVDWQSLDLGLKEPGPGETALEQQLRDYDDFIDWGLERARHPAITRAMGWLHDHAPAPAQVALCWGDARPANQIFHPEREECLAVIDWEMARLGDPVDDLAWWISVDRCFSEGIGVARLPGLPGRDETIKRWVELTGYDAMHVEYYEVLALLRFSVVMARVGQQLMHYDILPSDHTMDRDNLASLTLQRRLDEVGG